MAAPLSVACPHCQATIKLKSAASVGKKARCPKCREGFVVPAVEVDVEEDDEFAGLMGAGENEFEDYGGDEGENADSAPSRPKSRRSKKGKKKRKSGGGGGGGGAARGVMIACGVLLVLGLLGGGGFLLIKFLPRLGFGPPSRMAWLPDDTESFVEVRVADLWNAPALQPLKTAQLTTTVTDNVLNEFGIRQEEIDRLVIGKPPGSGAASAGDMVAVIYSKTPLTEQQRSTLTGGAQPTEYNGATYYLIPGKRRAVYFPEEDVAVQGPEQRIKAAIDSKGKCAAEERFPSLPSGHHFTLVALKPSGTSTGTQNVTSLPGAESLSADTLNSATMMFDADADLHLSADFVCVSADKAAEAAREFSAARDKLVSDFSQRKPTLLQAAAAMAALNGQGGGNAQANQEKTRAAIDSLEQSLQSVQATSNGDTVQWSISVSGQTIAGLADLFSMFSSSLPGLPGGASPTFPMPNQAAPTYPGR